MLHLVTSVADELCKHLKNQRIRCQPKSVRPGELSVHLFWQKIISFVQMYFPPNIPEDLVMCWEWAELRWFTSLASERVSYWAKDVELPGSLSVTETGLHEADSWCFFWQASQQWWEAVSVGCCLYLDRSIIHQLLGYLWMDSKCLLPKLPRHVCAEAK